MSSPGISEELPLLSKNKSTQSHETFHTFSTCNRSSLSSTETNDDGSWLLEVSTMVTDEGSSDNTTDDKWRHRQRPSKGNDSPTLFMEAVAAVWQAADAEYHRRIEGEQEDHQAGALSLSHNNDDDNDDDVAAPATHASLMEDVVEELDQVAHAVLDELRQTENVIGVDHEHPTFLLEMGLTRNLSLLPSDVLNAATRMTRAPPAPPSYVKVRPKDVDETMNNDDDDVDIELDQPMVVDTALPAVTKSPPFSAYILLAAAIVAMSAVGPLLQLQTDVTPTMKINWRMAGTSMLLAPFAVLEVYREGGLPHLTAAQWVTFLLSTFSYDFFCVAFCLALDFTSVGNATILANSMVLLLLIGKVCTGGPVTVLEAAGAVVAFGGAALCSKDTANVSGDSDDDGSNGLGTLFGDLLALSSAVGGLGYIVFARASRPRMPICLFMFLTMTVGCAMILVFQVAVLGEKVTFDRHVRHGIWGFLVWHRADRLALEVLMVVVCNVVGTMGWVQAMPHFSSVVVCSVVLLEPVIAEFLAFFSGTGSLPGWIGWVGNASVALGTFVVLCQSQSSEIGGGKSGKDP